MEKIELKPCPFCGGEAEIREIRAKKETICFAVWCKTCHATPDDAISINADNAVAGWNKRAGDTP